MLTYHSGGDFQQVSVELKREVWTGERDLGITPLTMEVEPLHGQDSQKSATRRALRMIKGRGTNKGEMPGE